MSRHPGRFLFGMRHALTFVPETHRVVDVRRDVADGFPGSMLKSLPFRTPLLLSLVIASTSILAAAGLWTYRNQADAHRIVIFVSSQKGAVAQTVEAIRRLTEKRISSINRAGGLHGKPVQLVYLDDHGNEEETKANAAKAIADERVIGMLGIWSSSSGAEVVAPLGKSGIPLISEISLDTVFAEHPNIFSMATAARQDVSLFQLFALDYPTVVFAGVREDLFGAPFRDALTDPKIQIQAEHWIGPEDEIDPDQVNQIVASVREKNPSLLCLAIGSYRGASVLRALEEAKLHPPVFLATGSIGRVLRNLESGNYSGSLYEIGSEIPGVDSERLTKLRRHRDYRRLASLFSDDDFTYGLIYSDMLGMLVETAQDAPEHDAASLRTHLRNRLLQLKVGERVHQGVWRDWAFTPQRSIARERMILWRPEGSTDRKLAPLSSGVFPVYLNIDMGRIRAVDSANDTFDADFHISLDHSLGESLDFLEFANACRGDDGQPLLRIERLSSQGSQVYKISGRFFFEPDLRAYPFDQQRFSISLRPSAGHGTTILLQPPAPHLRGHRFEIDGWTLPRGGELADVSWDEGILSVMHDYGSAQKIVPLHQFSFSWRAKRNELDFALRVVVPLALILIVAYFTVFIPEHRFDSIVAIQVTALLSTVALYMTNPKVDEETATISDQIFIFTEALICLMLGLSIVRENTPETRKRRIRRLTRLRLATTPLAILLMACYVMAVKH